MAQHSQPNNTDFSVALRGLLVQAKVHGLDTNDETVLAFLRHQAEVTAQQHALLRQAENTIHRMMLPR